MRIFGCSIKTFNEASHEFVKKVIRERDVDMLLLSECYFNEKSEFSYASYKQIFTVSKEVGIIYKKELQVDKISDSFNDDYSLFCRANTINGSLTVYATYILPKRSV